MNFPGFQFNDGNALFSGDIGDGSDFFSQLNQENSNQKSQNQQQVNSFIFDIPEDDPFNMDLSLGGQFAQDLGQFWTPNDSLSLVENPEFDPLPVPKHQRHFTQPVQRPKPPISNKKQNQKKEPETHFTVRKIRKTSSKAHKLLPPEECSEDERFYNACQDQTFVLNPSSLGFIPKSYWPDQTFAFGDIVMDFFRRKNNVNCRFAHKLFNAIQFSKNLPDLDFFTGVEWVGKDILKVDKRKFARLLGIHSIDGTLFHMQGNFSTHGFVEISVEEAKQIEPNGDYSRVDGDNVKLLIHQEGIFNRDVTEDQINRCKWVRHKWRTEIDSEEDVVDDVGSKVPIPKSQAKNAIKIVE